MLLQSDNVTKAMENMAQDMTTSLRSNDTQLLQSQSQNSTILAPDQTISGSVLVQTIFVTIRWEWLTLPVVTLLLASLFLAIVITGTRETSVGLWKSSPLTLLFQTFLVRRHQAAFFTSKETLDTVDGMQKAAASMGARALKGTTGGIEVLI